MFYDSIHIKTPMTTKSILSLNKSSYMNHFYLLQGFLVFLYNVVRVYIYDIVYKRLHDFLPAVNDCMQGRS